MKILIVDDEPLVRRALCRAAQLRGHETMVAEDGDEGIRLWKEWCPDLVFLDVLMPKRSGPEVLESMGTGGDTKVILMSAYSGEYNIERARSIGADLFVPKPFENILALVERAEQLGSV